jgi:hypothetical protein
MLHATQQTRETTRKQQADRHRIEMLFIGQMNAHGANASTHRTCNHSPEWDKPVF